MDQKQVRSPVDVDDGGWRGRVVGVTRIGSRAGFAATVVLAVLVGLVIYGISTAGHRHANPAGNETLTKAAEQHSPWWQALPDAQPSPPRLPAVLPTPARISVLRATVREPTVRPLVPNVAPLGANAESGQLQGGRERGSRQRALIEAATNAPISVRLNDEGGSPVRPGVTGSAAAPPSGTSAGGMTGSAPTAPAPSAQDERLAFVAGAAAVSARDQLPTTVHASASPFALTAGSVIPAMLLTGINADLPGTVVAQVREDVFDSVTGRYLLIPRGAKLTGTYDSRVVQGERRVLVAWRRLLYPDGSSLDLLEMEGTDPAGYAGFGAKVDEHLNKAFNSALLLSLISAGAQLSQPQRSTSVFAAPDLGQTIAGAVGQQIANTSIQLTQRQLEIPPTLEVSPGYRFDVLVDRDIVLSVPYNDGASDAP
jgi:type IV secretory pathway VirB10-like protein